MKIFGVIFTFLVFFEPIASNEPDFLATHCGIPMGSGGRPGWVNQIENRFQRAHFGTAHGAHGLSLNHVLSWEHIRDKIAIALQGAYNNPIHNNYLKIDWVLTDVFRLDQEAVVNIAPQPNLIPNFRREYHMSKFKR